MLSVGIVGLPNVGKSTLFNALTKNAVPAENFPFCTIDPSCGVVSVPDKRLDALAELNSSEKKINASVEFVDIAGLVRGASEGEGLGNKFLANIREVDAIAHVLRIFDDDSLHHVEGVVNPMRDLELVNLELVLADMESASKRLESAKKESRVKPSKESQLLISALEKIMKTLSAGKFASASNLSEDEKKAVKHLNLLTLKPVLYVLNKKSDGLNIFDSNDERWEQMREFIKDKHYVELDAALEDQLKDLDEGDAEELRRELGCPDSGVNELIKKSYELLGLISFFTSGAKESRAWTIKRGTNAKDAGAAIHSDFRDKFIRAETISWDKLLEAGSKAEAKKRAWLRFEGKDYIVQDGDVLEFLHS